MPMLSVSDDTWMKMKFLCLMNKKTMDGLIKDKFSDDFKMVEGKIQDDNFIGIDTATKESDEVMLGVSQQWDS